jgi:predicted metal-binding protein
MEAVPQVATVIGLLLMFTFIVAILTTTVLGGEAELWAVNCTEVCRATSCVNCTEACQEIDCIGIDNSSVLEINMYFGDVTSSMFTLFQFMTLDDWVSVCDLVKEQMPVFAVTIFYSFIVIVSFVILSLFSGVMVDHMNEVRIREDADSQEELMKEASKAKRPFQTIFGWTDSGDDKVGEEDFALLLSKPEYKEAVAASDLDLTRGEAQELFSFWDREHDKSLTWDEFKKGLEDYREGLTVKKVMIMKSKLKNLTKDLQQEDGGERLLSGVAHRAPPQIEQQLGEADSRLRRLETRMLEFEEKVRRARKTLSREAGACSPCSCFGEE